MLSQQLTFSTNPNTFPALCPGTGYSFEYTIPNACASDDYELIKTSGNYDFVLDQISQTLTIIPYDDPQNLKFEIEYSDTLCGEVGPGKGEKYNLDVKSIDGLAPTIELATNAYVTGKTHTFEITANLDIPYARGLTQDEVREYEWQILSGGQGWGPIELLNDNNGNTLVINKKAKFTTDLCNGAVIRVRGLHPIDCSAENSSWTTIVINRFAPTPSQISGPDLIICGQSDPMQYSVPKPGLSGISYNWNVPNGWTYTQDPQNPNIITVIPNGSSSGNISVTFGSCGLVSNPSVKNVVLKPIDPNSYISGINPVCNTNKTFTLNPAPNPGVNVYWGVSPSYLVTPSGGTGRSATFRASGSSGNGTLGFMANGCGVTTTISKSLQIGTPRINILAVNGGYGSTYNQICPLRNDHYVRVSMENETDNCIDNWDDNGSTATSYETCNEFDFTLQYNSSSNPPYNGVFLEAEASNSCGTSTRIMIFSPTYNACNGSWRIMASPNPAIGDINVELYYEDDKGKKKVKIDKFELLDRNGNRVMKIKVKKKGLKIKTNNLENGLYYMRATAWDKEVIDELLIQR